ncbi:MAG: TraR/DksA family transcriptional regulator [Patescibacteria group bacterium]
MENTHIKHFEGLLKNELSILEQELKSIGQRNPRNPADWEAKPDLMDTMPADSNEVADSIESYEENTGILKQLEIRFNEVKKALERTKNGTYGLCEVDREPIETKRLEANPAATTCTKHMK